MTVSGTHNRTTRIDINRIITNPNDYYNPVIDYYKPVINYYNPVIDYYNPVIDYYNPVIGYYNLLLRFGPCLNQLGLILIRLILILILDPVIDYCGFKKSPQPSLHAISRFWRKFVLPKSIDKSS